MAEREMKMKEYIENSIENLKKTLSWNEEDLEKSRLRLVERTSKCSAKEIADGWLESDIDQIRREVEEIKSLHDRITMLEYVLKNAE